MMDDTHEIRWMRRLIEVANSRFDGELSIVKFTTCWRIAFQIPGDDILGLPVGGTFIEAARSALESVGEPGAY